MTASLASACYVGHLRHRRHWPRRNHFRYPLFMVYLDLSELDSVFKVSPWWRRGRPAVARFHRADYLAPHHIPLDEAVRQRIASEHQHYPTGPIRMLTHLRYAGHCFNPVTFYYVFNDVDSQVEWVVAEITNTPWGERHCYVLRRNSHGPALDWTFAKAFHVSPFNEMQQTYRWLFREPGSSISVHMANREDGRVCFDATLTLQRRPMTGRWQQRLLLRYPLLTVMIMARIHLQALRLWWKGVPFFRHPNKRPATSLSPATHGAQP